MENKNLPVIFLLILIFFNFSLIIGIAASSSSPPDAYLIQGVHWHKQINDVFCGPAVLEMVFDFWGANINQTEIANVARTSSNGTYTWDMVRAGHFSELSASMGDYSPDNAPTSGFLERKLGYASFNYSSDTFWWPELKALVASDIPVVLLMKWAPDKVAGGHYRVIVGYDENKSDVNKSFVYFMDPWGRSNKKITNEDGTITWNMTDFEKAWNYSAYGTHHPHWGAIMMPWSVVLKTEGMTSKGSELKVTANITYPCPKPFDCDSYPASDTNATIIIPSDMHLEGQPQITIGSLRAGESAIVRWNVMLLDDDGARSWIKIKAEGFVSGKVPKIKKKSFVMYPSYEYTDNIGGEAKIKI